MMLPWMWGGWGFMGLGLLIVGVLIVLGSYVLYSAFSRPRTYRSSNALEIARQRYARGEITLQEFEQIKKSL
jgi:putative membrane protein